MKKIFYVIGLIIVFICVALNAVQSKQSEPKLLNRRILALYDSNDEKTPKLTLIHLHAEVILNHLGMTLDYRDINNGLPPDNESQSYYGVITWFQDSIMKNPYEYLDWLKKQILNNKKIIILNEFGAFEDLSGNITDSDTLNSVFNLFGVNFQENETQNPLLINISLKDSAMVEFERKLDSEANYYIQLKPIDNIIKTYLSLNRADKPDSESPMVFTCRAGGMVLPTYVTYYNTVKYTQQWRINPFLFFSEALDIKSNPAPDLTTYYGSRLLFTHIDGDGLISVSHIDPSKICLEVIIDEVFNKYYIPTSASVIIGDVVTADSHKWIKGRKDIVSIIKRMYSLPYIEPASHAYTHPLDWKKKITALAINGYSNKITAGSKNILDDSRYESLSMDMAFIEAPLEVMLKKEILESLEFLNSRLLPDTKAKSNLFFWSGSCDPQAEAIDFCRDNGIKNINGGDPSFDEENNSYTFLCPIKSHIGAGTQFYTAACNENIYTNLWNGPYYGYKNVIETFKRTESPIRIKPANIYYHFYSGERAASLSALKEVYDFAVSQDYFPVYTSKYLDIADDWFKVEIYEVEKGKTYIIKNNGCVKTIRFDNSVSYPDFELSKGVIGFSHYQGSLYVYLDEVPDIKITLTNKNPVIPYLKKSNADISDLKITESSLSCVLSGFGEIKVKFANLKAGTVYKIEFDNRITTQKTDSEGNLNIILPKEPPVKTKLELKAGI